MAVTKSLFTIGQISGIHGLKGYLKIRSFAESFDSFAPGKSVLLGVSKRAVQRILQNSTFPPYACQDVHSMAEEGRQWYEIERVNPHKKGLILMFKGVGRNIAETLVGQQIFILREDLPELEEDTYYWEDLIGLKVMDIESNYLGSIDHVMPTGSNDVFVVKGTEGEILVPALAWVVLSIDLDRREMTVNLPDGLR